jgi:glycosyltransferase involved in cell wall biosynthesis
LRKIRLAVFNTQPPHLYFGGVERRIVEIAKALSNEVQTSVFSGTKKGFREATRIGETNVVPCLSTDSFFPLDNWTFNRTISGMVGAVKADVFEGHAVSAYGVLRSLKKRDLSSRFIQTIHGVLADEYMLSSLSESQNPRVKLANMFMWRLSRLERELAQNSGIIVTVSKYSVRKILTYYGVEESKIRIVPNGVDCERFRPRVGSEELKRQLGLTNNRAVLFVGRLIPRKGLNYLVEAAEQIVKEADNVKFVIAGDGPMRDSLVAWLKRLEILDKFIFLGDVSDAMLPELYNCADIFALPSIQEGQGIALLEAQASGKPVVAFNVGAVSESIMEGQTGFLYEPNSQRLSSSLLRLLADAPLREKMGAKGREFVCDNYSWALCSRKMCQVYSEISS